MQNSIEVFLEFDVLIHVVLVPSWHRLKKLAVTIVTTNRKETTRGVGELLVDINAKLNPEKGSGQTTSDSVNYGFDIGRGLEVGGSLLQE